VTVVLAVAFDQQAIVATDRSHFDGHGVRTCDYERKRARFDRVLVGIAGLLKIAGRDTLSRIQDAVGAGGDLDPLTDRIRVQLQRSLQAEEQVTPLAARFLTVIVTGPLAPSRGGIRRVRFFPVAAEQPDQVGSIATEVDVTDPPKPRGWACRAGGEPGAAVEAERFIRAALRGRGSFQHGPLRLLVACAIDAAVRKSGPHENPAFHGQIACCGAATMVGYQ
jgi:hypothetical protein